MKILGLNYGHDSGASLIIDDKLVCAVNEERFIRKKLFTGFPSLSIDAVLKAGMVDFKDLDCIAVEGKHFIPEKSENIEKGSSLKKTIINYLSLEWFLLGTRFGIFLLKILYYPKVKYFQYRLNQYFYRRGFAGQIQYFDHHYCHALTAAYTHSMGDGLVITLDASGEGICSKIYSYKNGTLNFHQEIPCYHSPAYYYANITKFLGFIPLRHEGKITGLAAHGNYCEGYKLLKQLLVFDKTKNSFVNYGKYGERNFKILKDKFKGFSREDVAASIQKYVEDLVCEYVENSIKLYCRNSSTNLMVSGGLFANVKINQRMNELGIVDKLFIFPNMGDGGISLGAALAAKNYAIDIKNYYLGPSDDLISKEKIPSIIKVCTPQNLVYEVADKLNKAKVVALCSGRMEFGPRALGNRSILYKASDIDLNKLLNERLGRTEFMPFAPVVRDVDALDFFKIKNGNLKSYQFMTMTCDVTDKCRAEAPAIVHIDNTARPQVITRECNQIYYDILTEYKRISGKSILVNTSFNMHEEPIVNSANDAVRTFLRSGIDCLVLGEKLYENDPTHNHVQTM